MPSFYRSELSDDGEGIVSPYHSAGYLLQKEIYFLEALNWKGFGKTAFLFNVHNIHLLGSTQWEVSLLGL